MFPAVVVDVADPDGQGRVRVRLPWVAEDEGEQATAWARLSTLMAGAGRGTWFVPEPEDEVLVAFVAGDPRWPVVVGALWNGVDTPPETMDGAGQNDVRSITSRAGHVLTFDDTAGAEKVELKTKLGHTLTLDDASGGTVTLEHTNGATIEIDATGTVTVRANAEVKIDAPAGMSVTAAKVDVTAAMSTFSGVVKCDTLITNAVVSTAYTMGAGNVW
ncbi:MAG: type IV secretion protein Rhs [Myxococcales bacterium]|nr:type IV secretion protein Rhs [Myxococcales bacterium]